MYFDVVLVMGQAVIPAAFEQAEAKCDGSKNNGDACKDKKPKRGTELFIVLFQH
jgi:hypothetical protein